MSHQLTHCWTGMEWSPPLTPNYRTPHSRLLSNDSMAKLLVSGWQMASVVDLMHVIGRQANHEFAVHFGHRFQFSNTVRVNGRLGIGVCVAGRRTCGSATGEDPNDFQPNQLRYGFLAIVRIMTTLMTWVNHCKCDTIDIRSGFL